MIAKSAAVGNGYFTSQGGDAQYYTTSDYNSFNSGEGTNLPEVTVTVNRSGNLTSSLSDFHNDVTNNIYSTQWYDNNNYYESPLFYINSGLSATGVGITIKGQVHISNELWHINKTPKNASLKSRIRFRNDSRWKNPVSRAWRNTKIAKVANIRNVGNKLGYASLLLTSVNIYKNEEIKASDVLNTFMVGISFTGFGAIVSGAYFLVDISLTVTIGRSIGDRLDGTVGEPLVQWHD